MSKAKTSKLDWLVAARGWAMLGVFIGHTLVSLGFEYGHHDHAHWLLKPLGRVFDPMVITFFILIIGAFYQHTPKPYSRYIALKFSQRLLPVFFYALLTIPFYFLLPPPNTTALEAISKAPFYLLGIPWLNWPSWFLIALFMAELFYFFVFPISKSKRNSLLLAFALVSVGWAFNYYKFEHPTLFILGMIWMAHSIPLFLAIFLVGAVSKKTILKMSHWPYQKVVLVFIASLILLGMSIAFNRFPSLPDDHWLQPFIAPDRISNFAGQYGNYFWFLLASTAGPLAFMCFCRLAPVTRFMRLCGDYSLILIGLNGLFMNILNRPLVGLFAQQTDSDVLLLLYCSLLGLGSLAVSLYCAIALDKLFPQLCGKPMLSGPILPALYRKKA